MITQWLTLLGLMLVIGLWLGAMRSREKALRAARGVCKSQAVQLLDETVGLGGLRLRRHNGQLRWMLRYDFEVSTDGHDRYAGHLWMVAGHVVGMHGEWPTPPPDTLDVNSRVVDLMRRLGRQDGNGAT